MQSSSTTVLSLVGRRGLVSQHGTSLFGSAVRLKDQCMLSTNVDQQTEKPSRQPPIAVSLSWSSPAQTKTLGSKPASAPISGGEPITSRTFPYIVEKKAASAVRIKQRAEDAAAKKQLALQARNAAAKIRQQSSTAAAKVKADATVKKLQAITASTKLKAAAEKEKQKAKVQKAKDLITEREALRVRRAPSAYALYVKERFKALDNLPTLQRFQRISAEFKELKPDVRQKYDDTSAMLKAETVAKRAAVLAAKVPAPLTAFLLFYSRKYKENKAADPKLGATASVVDIAKLIGSQWRALSESEKQLFKIEAAKGRNPSAVQ